MDDEVYFSGDGRGGAGDGGWDGQASEESQVS